MNIDIQYRPGAQKLKINPNGSWIDLYTYEDVYIAPYQFVLIDLGVAMKLPEGYEAIIAPRSSTYKHWNILQANSIGVVDPTFCGKNDWWKFPAVNNTPNLLQIPAGTRLCQFRIQKAQPEIVFNEVTLEDSSRGSFGTSGV